MPRSQPAWWSELVSLCDGVRTCHEVAAQLNRPYATVWRAATCLGLQFPHGNRKDDANEPAELVAKRSTETHRRAMSRAKARAAQQAQSNEAATAIVRRLNSNESAMSIANSLGISRQRVYQLAERGRELLKSAEVPMTSTEPCHTPAQPSSTV